MGETQTIGIIAAIVTGITGAGGWISKVVFVTKKDLRTTQSSCQANICKRLDKMSSTLEKLGEQQQEQNIIVAEHMGATNRFVEDHERRMDRDSNK